MIIGFGNNVVSSLAADITASQTTIQVMPGAGAMFANLLTSDYANSSNPLKTYAKITLTDAKETIFEVCHLTAVNNDMLTVIRGQEGTTAKGWSLNDVIANFATRGSENQFVQIEELQSGHYVAGVAGGTENNLTLELPATYFVNGGADWTLRTPLVVIPALNNTGASTLQLTMGGRVLGIFPLYKGNKAELSANDIIKDVPVLCVLDNTKTYFSVLNPLEIYLGSRYLQKDQNLSDVPDKAKGRSSLEVYSKTESDENYMAKSQCGADIPNKPLFLQNVGLTETVEQARNAVPSTRKVNGKALTTDITLTSGDIGALPVTGGKLNGPLGIGTDNALGGNSIVFGDNDTGFKWHSDGVLGIYANNALVGYIDNSGLHMSVDVLTNGAVRAGNAKKLSLTSNNNSTMTATFNLWGDANRPTVIELDDDQGWHLYSQRNPDGSIVFTVNGDITANTLRAGGAIYQNNGDIFGSLWGNDWLSTWINNNLVLDVQLGAGTSVTTWNNAGSWPNTPGYVVTSVWKDAQGENIDGINYAPLQKRVGNQWYTVQGGTV
ncbi:phage tail protein [Salmonella enterica]|uniref:Phage tail protein n=1 Tax=Salmonella enterica TaxID=28901 RepID=A0A639WF83_SALER|nr:phage tail protein [Salmonella enterica]EDC3618295.1 phage tail protein [Salmonella enterica]EDJ5793266.1 phage tail protein [Salmonella enterica]EIA3422480.1 phage tail protein [Salmonella enterica]